MPALWAPKNANRKIINFHPVFERHGMVRTAAASILTLTKKKI